jgi:NADPH2:quinone reductase
MKAIVMTAHGGPEVLKIDDIEIGRPEPGQVLADIAFAGVNFMDTGTRRGIAGATDLPFTPGVEGAGTVLAVGEGVIQVKPGDRVAWYYVWKSYAQQVLAPADQLVPLPDDIDFETAASLMMQGLTASHFVLESHAVKPGDVALVHAAAGGVGQMLSQMIRKLGGTVIGRVSNAEKVAQAKAAGANEVIVDREGKFADEVLRLTNGRGVNVVYDGTGVEGFEDSVRSLDYHGSLVLFGPLTGPTMQPINIWRMPKSIKLTYPAVMHHARTREALVAHSAQLFEWVRSGDLKVHIGRHYPLAEAVQAHIDIESRNTTGKLLLRPNH